MLRIAWPFLVLGIVASLTVSPIATADSKSVLAAYLNDFVIPHFPPLYLLFTRLISRVPEVLAWPVAEGQGTLREPHFDAADIKLILLTQHALTIIAAAYLADRLPLGILGRRVVIGVLCFNPFTLFATHSLLTEALVTPAMFAAVAEAVPLLASERWSYRRLVLFSLWVALGALTRHIVILVGLILPIGFAIRAVLRWRAPMPALGSTAISLAAMAAVLIVTQQASNLTMMALGVEPRSVFGRAFTYRLTPASLTPMSPGEFFILVGDQEFRAALHRLQEGAPPSVAETLADVESSAFPFTWVEPFNKVRARLEAKCPACPLSAIWADVDRDLNRAALYSLASLDRTLMRDALARAVQVLFPASLRPGGLADPYALSWVGSLWPLFDFEAVPPTRGLNPPALQRSFTWRAATDLGVVVTLARRGREFAVPALFLLTISLLPFVPSAAFVVLPIFAVIVATAAATALLTVYIYRYGLMLDQLAITGFTLAAAFAVRRYQVSRPVMSTTIPRPQPRQE